MLASTNTILSGRNNRRGFTIVELLIVIVVIGILAAITIVAYNGVQARAQDSHRLAEMNKLRKGLEVYFTLNGQYPQCNGADSCTSTGWSQAGGDDIAALPVTPPVRKDPKNADSQWGYYYARLYTKTGANTYAYTGKITDYIIATRLSTGQVSIFSAWNNANLNYLDGGSAG